MPCTIQISFEGSIENLSYKHLSYNTNSSNSKTCIIFNIFIIRIHTYVSSSKLINLQYYYQYYSLSKTTLNIGNHLYSKLGVHSSRSTCVVLICRQTQFSSNRRNNDGHCNSNSSQNNREGCNGLSVDKRLYPSLSQCR